MDAQTLLSSAAAHSDRGEAPEAVDAAVHAYALADNDQIRTRAATAAAASLIERGFPADAIGWCNRALALSPTDPAALATRASAQLAQGRAADALADLDAAGVKAARGRIDRALALRALDRDGEAGADLDAAVDDPVDGAWALRIRGNARLAGGDTHGGLADLTAAARRGDTTATALLAARDALPATDGPEPEAAFEVLATRVRELRAESPDAATELADRLLADPRLPALVRTRLAIDRAYLGEGGWEDIVARLEPLVAADPTDVALLTRYGRALYQVDRDGEAAQVLARAAAAAPGTGLPERYLGDVYAYAQNWSTAHYWYDRAAAIAPHDPHTMQGRADALDHEGCADAARELMLRAAIGGDEPAQQWCRQRELTLPDERFETASWQLGSMGHPGLAAPAFVEAARIWQRHSFGTADYCARQAAGALTNAAVCRSQLGEYALAEELAREALRLRPEHADGWNNLGNVLTHTGQLGEALEAFDRCAWCDPEYAGAGYGRADVLRRLGRQDAALAAMDAAIAVGYADPGRQRDLYYRRARLHQAAGDWDRAAADYAEAGLDDLVEAVAAVERIHATPGDDVEPDGGYRAYGLTGYDGEWERVRWAYRIQFRDLPDAAARQAIAVAAMNALGGSYLEPDRDWLWSDRYALMRVTLIDAGLNEELPMIVAPAIAAIHEVAAVVEVVGFGATEVDEGDERECWSLRRQAVPDPGPEFDERIEFWVPRTADTTAYPAPMADDEFEAALRGVATANAMAQARQRVAASEARRTAGEIILVPVDTEEVPARAPTRDLAGLRHDPDDYPIGDPDGAGLILRRREGYFTGLDHVSVAGTVTELVGVDGPDSAMLRHLHAAALTPDGRHAVYATYLGHQLWSVEVATGARTRLVEADIPAVETLTFVDSARLLVKTAEWLAVFAFDGTAAGLRVLARAVTDDGPAYLCQRGQVVVTAGVSPPQLVVFGLRDNLLGRLAEITADINCYRVWEADGRVFAADAITFELVNLHPAGQRFKEWVRTQAARPAPAGLLATELAEQPRSRIGEAPAAVLATGLWCVSSSDGLVLACRPEGEGWEMLTGDADGVHPFDPPLSGASLEYEWEPAGAPTALFADTAGGALFEADFATWRVRRIEAEPVRHACYTRDGHAALVGSELVLYRWRHGGAEQPVELTRLPVRGGEVSTVGTAWDGTAIYVAGAGRTAFFQLTPDGVRPLGAFPSPVWQSGWLLDDAMVFATAGDGAKALAYRVTGFDAACAAAPPPVIEIDLSDQPAARLDLRDAYPGTTAWSL